ncbi:MAG: hypothetical protein UT05_C0016G0002 [Parcubacteria group bacterium GW2011_GWF2_38_76]|nr:MAG: hypothetical protein UT05_C0016G0002 [Parcubacteria group bacterium GW2011_GWF2_38_76]
MGKLTIIEKVDENVSTLTPIKEIVLRVNYSGQSLTGFIETSKENVYAKKGIFKLDTDEEGFVRVIFDRAKIHESTVRLLVEQM